MQYWEDGSTSKLDEYCWKCGQPYIRECPSCKSPLENLFRSMKLSFEDKPRSFPRRSDFCGKCGNPYPWTESEHQKIEEAGFWALLHPRITGLAKSRFAAGHYADAVEATFKELNARVKKIYSASEGIELDGADLMRKALRLEKPIILLDDLKTESGRNIQEGYSHILAGAMQAIRNPKAHANIEISSDRACHLLMLASLLFHQIDERRSVSSSEDN